MKFSTIAKTKHAYETFPGACFEWHSGGSVAQAYIVARPVEINEKPLRPQGTVRISNELLASPDVLIDWAHDRLTILRAAVRIGAQVVLVPESEAARCEVQHCAQAVWIPDPIGPFRAFGFYRHLVEFGRSIKVDFARQILMPGLAILTEGDVLDVFVTEHSLKEVSIFKGMELCKDVYESFKVTFDGTNLLIDGVSVERPDLLRLTSRETPVERRDS